MKGMRCRKHPTDFSSAVGVCASCLRHRLIAIIAAQTEAHQLQQQQQQPHDSQQQQPYPLPFPRSVSPYISRRKSDTAATWHDEQNDDHRHRRFFNTPQVGPNGSLTMEVNGQKKKGKRSSKGLFSFLGIFRSKSNKSDAKLSNSGPISDPGVSPSWFAAISRKKTTRAFSLETGLPTGVHRSIFGRRDRGMSPARYSDAEEDEHCHGSSGYSSESSNWKQTPRRTPARRAAVANGRNLSVFCMSPLVRPSPCRLWSQKSAPPPETATSGEARVPVKSHLSNAPSFCKNRSKKLADIGRYNYNSNY